MSNAALAASPSCPCLKAHAPIHTFHCRVCARGITGLPPRSALAADKWFAERGMDSTSGAPVCVTCKPAAAPAPAAEIAPPVSGVRRRGEARVCLTSDEMIAALVDSIDDAQIGVLRPSAVADLDPHERASYSPMRRRS